MPNFAIIVAPLDSEEYLQAMDKLTVLQGEGFKVEQRNMIVLYDSHIKKERPYCVYWLERPLGVDNVTSGSK